MRSTILLLATLAVAIATTATGVAQAQNLYPLTPVPEGSDTLMVDTNGFGTAVTDTFYDSLLYDRRHISIQFHAPVIPPESIDPDSLVRYQWEDIDTAYSEQRAAFAYIDTSLSPLTLIKAFPGIDSGKDAQLFSLDLSEHLHWHTIRDILDSVDSMTYGISRYDDRLPSHVPSDPAFDPRNDFPDLVGPIQ